VFLLLTGTFTAGDSDISFGEHMSKAIAAGANPDNIINTTVAIDNGGGYAAGTTILTLDTLDARAVLQAGQRIYIETASTAVTSAMATGVIATVDGATTITLKAPGLSAAVADNDVIHVNGGFIQHVTTSRQGAINTGIDNVNKVLSINCGVAAATGTVATVTGGTYWILGQR